MFFKNGACLICQDLKHANCKEREANRIYNYIKKYTNRYSFKGLNPPDSRLFNGMDITNHFMCGNCPKFNSQQLKHTYYLICSEICNLIEYFNKNNIDKKEQKRLLFNIHNAVRGHYPQLATYVYRNLQKS